MANKTTTIKREMEGTITLPSIQKEVASMKALLTHPTNFKALMLVKQVLPPTLAQERPKKMML